MAASVSCSCAAYPKNAFDIEKFLSTKLKLKPEEEFEVFDTGAAAGSESA